MFWDGGIPDKTNSIFHEGEKVALPLVAIPNEVDSGGRYCTGGRFSLGTRFLGEKNWDRFKRIKNIHRLRRQ
jgi:hypothetical protein